MVLTAITASSPLSTGGDSLSVWMRNISKLTWTLIDLIVFLSTCPSCYFISKRKNGLRLLFNPVLGIKTWFLWQSLILSKAGCLLYLLGTMPQWDCHPPPSPIRALALYLRAPGGPPSLGCHQLEEECWECEGHVKTLQARRFTSCLKFELKVDHRIR